MKKILLLIAVSVALVSAPALADFDMAASVSSLQTGADRLVDLQNNDGGWDYPLDDGDPNDPSPVNTIGPIAMGLAKAYQQTGDADHLAALDNAGDLLLNKTNNFSPSDGYLAAQLDDVFGGTTYVDHVTANFYDPLANGTYNRNGDGTLYDTAGHIDRICTGLAGGDYANQAAWDIGMGLVGAQAAGADTSAWIVGTKAEINKLDGNAWFDVLGLAGGVYGLAAAGETFDPTAGEHSAASSVADLAETLVSYQIDGGGFAWNSNYVISDDDNEAIMATAYAVLALNEVDRAGYWDDMTGAVEFMTDVQFATGGWEQGAGTGENNERTGEALWATAVVTPEPASMLLFGSAMAGGLAAWRRKKNKK